MGLLGLAILSLGAFGCKPPEAQGGTTGETSTTGTDNPDGGSTSTGMRPAPTAEGPKVEGDVIKIGLVASENGDLKPWGVDSKQGAQLAVEEANAAGGINGKQIQLLVQDSQSEATVGKTAAEKLASDGVIGILGEVASGITMQLANVAYEKGLPLIAVGATKPEITDTGSNIFRVCYTDDFQGPVMAKFAYEKLGLRNIAIMTDVKQPYSVYLSKSFKEKFEQLGGKVVDEQSYESKQTQFAGQLTTIKQKNPDGLFLSGYFTEVGPIAKQAYQAGMTNVKFLGGDGWDSSQLVTSGGEAIIGGFFCNHYNNQEDRPVVKNFLEKWKKKYGGEPGTTMGALGYDSAALMIDALKRASSLDAKSVIEALENTEGFEGVSGTINLKGNNGNPPKRALVVSVEKAGQKFAAAYEPNEVN